MKNERRKALLSSALRWLATTGVPEFGSAIFGFRAFRGAARSIVPMPAKRGIATDDRNWVAAHLVELALGRAKTDFPLIIPPLEPSGS